MPRYFCHLMSSSSHPRGRKLKVAEKAEDRKAENYQGLPPSHAFTPLAIETMGAVGPRSLAFLKDLGRRIAMESGEPKSTDYLLQQLSVAVQRGVLPCRGGGGGGGGGGMNY